MGKTLSEHPTEKGKEKIDVWLFFLAHKLDASLFAASVLLGVLFDWDIMEVGIFTIFIAVILGYVSLRSIGIAAIFFLAFTPILLFLDRETRAEEFAVYAYYFLVMAVIRGIIEVRGEARDSSGR